MLEFTGQEAWTRPAVASNNPKKGAVPRIVAFWFIFVGLKFYGRRSVEASIDLGFWKAAMKLWRVEDDVECWILDGGLSDEES